MKAQRGSGRIALLCSLTSPLGGDGGQRYALAALPPGNRHITPFYERLGGPHGRSGRVRKI